MSPLQHRYDDGEVGPLVDRRIRDATVPWEGRGFLDDSGLMGETADSFGDEDNADDDGNGFESTLFDDGDDAQRASARAVARGRRTGNVDGDAGEDYDDDYADEYGAEDFGAPAELHSPPVAGDDGGDDGYDDDDDDFDSVGRGDDDNNNDNNADKTVRRTAGAGSIPVRVSSGG